MGLMKNTVRLGAEFTTFDGDLVDPTSQTLVISNQKTSASIVSVDETGITRTSLGVYYYDYVVPVGITNLLYEWIANIEGTQVANRKILIREWIKE